MQFTEWRESSFSGTRTSRVELAWRKSTFSATDACVEIAQLDIAVGVRDSKNPGGGRLAVPHSAFVALTQGFGRSK